MSLLPPFEPVGTQSYFDPFLSYAFYDPYSGRNNRRRLIPADEGDEVPGGEGASTRRPFTIGSAGWTRSIPVDFIEREKEYVVRADVPGVHKDEIHVEVHDENVLRFGHNPQAERQREDEEEKGIFHRAERVSTFRNRNLRMPDDADLKGEIKAAYEDGVLTIKILKNKPGLHATGKKIPVA